MQILMMLLRVLLNLSSHQKVALIALLTLQGRHSAGLVCSSTIGNPLIKPAIEITWDDWDMVVDATLKGTYFLTCRIAEQFIKAGRSGNVVNIASTHGIVGWPLRTVYSTAKGGMIQTSRMSAIEWADKDIRVNTVSPATVMTESRIALLNDPKARANVLARIPIGWFVEASKIAAAVLYFAGPNSASTTGQMLVVDGGLTVV